MDEKLIKLKQLRSLVPISISDGLAILEKTKGDIQTAINIFIEDNLDRICDEYEMDRGKAAIVFEAQKYDINKTLIYIREQLYDDNYVKSDLITLEKLDILFEWMRLFNMEGFHTALYYEFDTVISLIKQMPNLNHIENAIVNAHNVKRQLFSDLGEHSDLQFSIKRTNEFKRDKTYLASLLTLEKHLYELEREFDRHYRNLKPSDE